MQVNRGPRLDMLSSLRDNIVAAFTEALPNDSGLIEFFDLDGDNLCNLAFKEIEKVESSSNATYRFVSIDDSYTLKGVSIDSGTVSSFKIRGYDSDESGNEYIVVGTVGSLASNADLKFNITTWQVGTYITIENFDFILPSGS